MQQIFNFIIKNSNRLLFLLLLGISFSLTIQSHSYHKSKIISSANVISGGVYEKMNDFDAYFNLQQQNIDLAKENTRLKMLIFNKPDTIIPPTYTGLNGIPETNVIVSNIIHNSYNVHENFLTLGNGEKDGIKTDMGVINDMGIVGIVDNTSPNYATVLSILNTKSQINAKIKKSNHFGTLKWNGKNAGFVQLIDVPRLAAIRKGDTIVTGGQSIIFPENINIGTIENIYIEKETNYYTLNIRLFNDMTNLGHVYVIKRKDSDEIRKLEAKSKNE